MKPDSLLLLALLAIASGPAGAQAPTVTSANRDAADSAATARTEYRAAREALARGDTAVALDQLQMAAQTWPLQPAYSAALLDLAVRMRDIKRTDIALGIANRIGVALTVSETVAALMDAMHDRPSFRTLRAQQEMLRAPMVRSKAFRTLSDSALFPEGVSVDARNGTIYVSSVRHRNVLAVAADGREDALLRGEHTNVGGIFGIAVDTTRGVLWAASAAIAAMDAKGDSSAAIAALLAIRLSDGALVRRIPVPANVANSSPGDIALLPNGDVLVSDSQAPVLWWLRGTSDTLIAIRHHLFRSLQGIVPSADGRVAWVADYSHGLLRVELASGAVQRVADLPGHTTVGMDGMMRYGDSFVAVQNGFAPMQVVQITLDAQGTRVTQFSVIDRNGAATSPTGGVIVQDHFVYVANSLWERLDASGKIPMGAALPRPLLLSVPLKR